MGRGCQQRTQCSGRRLRLPLDGAVNIGCGMVGRGPFCRQYLRATHCEQPIASNRCEQPLRATGTERPITTVKATLLSSAIRPPLLLPALLLLLLLLLLLGLLLGLLLLGLLLLLHLLSCPLSTQEVANAASLTRRVSASISLSFMSSISTCGIGPGGQAGDRRRGGVTPDTCP